MTDGTVPETFQAALDSLVDQIKRDNAVLAAILCGSLSHDTVWAKSDIDLMLITLDDRNVPASSVSLYADGINVHTHLMPRTQFRAVVEGAIHSSFEHSLFAKGRLLYTHDRSIADLFERLHDLGERDLRIQLLHAATSALASLYKAHKWFITRGDLDYTALWILYATTALAKIEVISARLLVDREVIPQALKLNPRFFKIVYTDLLNSKKTKAAVKAALDAADGYIADRTEMLFAEVIDHLRDAGEPRSCTEIENHFSRNFGVSNVTTACEYLADQGIIGKGATSVRLTRRSSVDVQELAFFYLERPARR
jgi:hypothetical protein